MKQKTRYKCTNCEYISIKWIGCCPQCSEWNSLSEIVQAATSVFENKNTKTRNAAHLHSLATIKTNHNERMVSNINEWDRVVGGGILPGSFIILTGDPGIGNQRCCFRLQVQSLKIIASFISHLKNRSDKLKIEASV